MKARLKTFLIWVGLLLAMTIAYVVLSKPANPPLELLTPEAFWRDYAEGTVASIRAVGTRRWQVRRSDHSCYEMQLDIPPETLDSFENIGVDVTQVDECGTRAATSASFVDSKVVIIIALVVAAFFMLLRRLRNNQKSVLGLAKSTARLVSEIPATRFSDVGGADEAKEWLQDICRFLKDPQSYTKVGARVPRGVLLQGPPGVGKTLLARALAGEAGVAFFECSGSEFIELFVGVGAARVRDLFEEAKKKSPSVIFIDELDAIGRRRGASDTAMVHQEREQTLNQLLVSMDGFSPTGAVIVLAATNRADVLDPALLRPGRFDVRVSIPVPDVAARRRILAIHTQKKPLAADVDLDALAHQSHNHSGAELEFLVNEAALRASRASRSVIVMQDFEDALSRHRKASVLDTADALLLESASQFATPMSNVRIRVQLNSGEQIEGKVLWAAPQNLKLELADQSQRVVMRAQIASVTTLEARAVDEEVVRASVVPAGQLRVG